MKDERQCFFGFCYLPMASQQPQQAMATSTILGEFIWRFYSKKVADKLNYSARKIYHRHQMLSPTTQFRIARRDLCRKTLHCFLTSQAFSFYQDSAFLATKKARNTIAAVRA